MSKILFVALALPLPTTNGHRMRNRGLLQALASEGHEVTLLSFAEPSEIQAPSEQLSAICSHFELVPIPEAVNGAVQYFRRLKALAGALPYGAVRFRSTEMKRLVQHKLASGQYDAVVCDDIYNFSNIPSKLPIPLTLNKHDITHEIMERFLSHERNPVKRAYGKVEQRRIRRLEAEGTRRSALVLVCSERDGQILSGLAPDVKCVVVPNVIDISRYTPQHSLQEPRTVLYVGAMDWYPNRDAVEFFADKILPNLRRRVPGVRFRIAGRSVPEDLRARYLAVPDIEFTGEVADMASEIAKATVCVVPLRIGSGTRLKILEAGAMEKAVVSTGIGAEGLNFENGKEIIIEDKPEAFAEATALLLDNAQLCRNLGVAARNRVETQFSIEALQLSMASVMSQIQNLRKSNHAQE